MDVEFVRGLQEVVVAYFVTLRQNVLEALKHDAEPPGVAFHVWSSWSPECAHLQCDVWRRFCKNEAICQARAMLSFRGDGKGVKGAVVLNFVVSASK